MKKEDFTEAQQWFLQNAGRTLSWAAIKATRPLLATQAEGIYKPAGHEYALSVKETLSGPYPDKGPVYCADGSWLYEYFQKNPDPALRDKEPTNRAMMACRNDKVPVGVMIQTKQTPGAQYKILGLAYVTGWDEGYFYLESYDETLDFQPGPRAEIEQITRSLEQIAEEKGSYDPSIAPDSRKRVIANIVQRRGQTKFRKQLIDSYTGRCAVSKCDAVPALEAAHITPYRGPDSNCTTNGLLLRADIHTLWDLGLLAVDPDTFRIILSDELLASSYSELENQLISLPINSKDHPSKAALSSHLEWTGLGIDTDCDQGVTSPSETAITILA